ncbi:metallophosphoesterase family protein [Sulfitobacter aestuarii]|uniref:Metallophosphoesterase family protein n=1 Tax=Sulfitobacter aestuarii TaxID=2161676 RepID=A0ABW5TY39_9RHOB
MSRLIHLSDLHFGKDRADLLEPLLGSVNESRPDLVAISGDLTQRAREREYRAARAFVDRIEAPVLSVPGNHDIPVHRPATRFLWPWRYYKRWIDSDLTPVHRRADCLVVGVNTVDRFRWQTGRLSHSRARRACAALRQAEPGMAKVIVAHHPLNHPNTTKKKPIPGAEQALETLIDCGADMILSGHLHVWHAGAFAHRASDGGQANAIQIHAGTSLSSRVRGEPNDYNVIDIAPERFTIARISFDDATHSFTNTETRHFDRVSGRFLD